MANGDLIFDGHMLVGVEKGGRAIWPNEKPIKCREWPTPEQLLDQLRERRTR